MITTRDTTTALDTTGGSDTISSMRSEATTTLPAITPADNTGQARDTVATMIEPFNITEQQADTLHRKWFQHRVQTAPTADNPIPLSSYSDFVALFRPGFTGNGSIEGYVEYGSGGGIYLCILADGSCHS
jgi:hypothetical protein